jgi:hypothetical protein
MMRGVQVSEIRNQLQTLTGSAITSAQLSDVGGKVFTNALESQEDLVSLVQWWRSIHAPTYGFPIPGSGKSATGSDVSPQVLNPGTNETAYIMGLSCVNDNATDAATVSITVGNAQVFSVSVAPGGAEVATLVGAGAMPPFFLPAGVSLDIASAGTTPGDISWTLAYGLSVQG